MLKDSRSFNQRQYTFDPYGIEVNIDEKNCKRKASLYSWVLRIDANKNKVYLVQRAIRIAYQNSKD
jgi:hypothetical protein